jgi:hypothetical protein
MSTNFYLIVTFLLAQKSYMPAQDIHILVNPSNDKLGPWYSRAKNIDNY